MHTTPVSILVPRIHIHTHTHTHNIYIYIQKCTYNEDVIMVVAVIATRAATRREKDTGRVCVDVEKRGATWGTRTGEWRRGKKEEVEEDTWPGGSGG